MILMTAWGHGCERLNFIVYLPLYYLLLFPSREHVTFRGVNVLFGLHLHLCLYSSHLSAFLPKPIYIFWSLVFCYTFLPLTMLEYTAIKGGFACIFISIIFLFIFFFLIIFLDTEGTSMAKPNYVQKYQQNHKPLI